MSAQMRADPNHLNARNAILAVALIFAAVAGLAMLNTLGGPASRCLDYGGQLLVGPGGETSCVNKGTFLPIEGYNSAPE